MSRRIVDNADETEDKATDVEGHAIKSGRVTGEPEGDHTEVKESEDEDVEGELRSH